MDMKGAPEFKMVLTRSELEVMNVIWRADRPVSRNDILDLSENRSWKESSIHILLNGLLKKEAIREDGFVRCGKTFGRLFSANITCEDYYAEEVFSAGSKESIPVLFSALVRRDDLDMELVDELEAILNEKRKELNDQK